MARGSSADRKASSVGKRKLMKPGQTGVVGCYLSRTQSGGRSAGIPTSRVIAQVRAGLAYSELEVLQSSLGLPIERLATHVGLSRATLQRRKKNAGTLNAIQSDRVVRLARLMGKAIEVLESEEDARQWLTSSQHGLGGATPLEFCDTEVGAREVENLLGRIEHGVFS